MKLIEIKGVGDKRRFINLGRVVKIEILEDGAFRLDLPGGPEVIEKGSLGYDKMLTILGITHSPASQTSQVE